MRVELFFADTISVWLSAHWSLTGTHGLPHAWPVMKATKDGVTPWLVQVNRYRQQWVTGATQRLGSVVDSPELVDLSDDRQTHVGLPGEVPDARSTTNILFVVFAYVERSALTAHDGCKH